MADHVLEFEAKMKDLLSSETKKINSTISELNKNYDDHNKKSNILMSSIKKLSAAYLSFQAVKKTIGFFQSTAQAAMQQQEALVMLTKNLGYYSQSLVDLSGKLQTTTKYGDDVTQAAMGILATFTKNEEQIKTMIPLIQDYATVYNKDLNSAALAFGKALNGQGVELSRYGFKLDGAKTKSERFAALQYQAEQRLKGAASVAAQFGSGSLTQLKNLFGDVSEKIGDQLIPYLNDFVKVLIDNMGLIESAAIFIGKSVVTLGNTIGTVFRGIQTGVFGTMSAILKYTSFGNATMKEWAKKLDEYSNEAALSTVQNFNAIFEPWDKATNRVKDFEKNLKKIKMEGIKSDEDVDTKSEEEKRQKILDLQLSLAEEKARLESQSLQSQTNNVIEALEIRQREEQNLLKLKYDSEYQQLSDNLGAQRLLTESYKIQQQQIDIKYNEERKEAQAKANEEEWEMLRQHTENLKAVEESRANIRKQLMSGVVSTFEMFKGKSKAMFNVWKSLAIAEAFVNTRAAAVAAYKNALMIPMAGTFMAPAAAAAAILAGVSQINQIKSIKFASGGIVPGNKFVGDRVPIMANSGEILFNNRQQSNLLMQLANNKTPNFNSNRNTNVTINLSAPTNNVDAKSLSNLIVDNIDNILVEADRKNRLTNFRSRMN